MSLDNSRKAAGQPKQVVTFCWKLLFPVIVPLLARMRVTDRKCCNEDRLQLALAHPHGIRKHSDKTDVFAIRRQREGNWKGQEAGHNILATHWVWSPTIWRWLWHGCLVKINHVSATRLWCPFPGHFSCWGRQSSVVRGQQAPPLRPYLNKQQLLLEKCPSVIMTSKPFLDIPAGL